MLAAKDLPGIVIADSQFLIVDSLVRLIEAENKYAITGIAENRKNLISLLNSGKADILITDHILVDYSDLEDLKLITENHKPLTILILTNQLTSGEVRNLIKSGIRNIALKTDERQELLISIEMAANNRKHFSDEILDLILEPNDMHDSSHELSNLTVTEKEIVRLIGNGFTTKEIAGKKHISVHTVMTHRKNIFRKLEINSISDLTRFAIRNGLTDIIEYNI